MDLSDFVLKTRVGIALARDPRVRLFDIDVRAENGTVVLSGDLDTEEEVWAALSIARGVEGVQEVHSSLTIGVRQGEEKSEHVAARLLDKLEAEWEDLPERTPAVVCDYMRWALWLVYKFHMPAEVAGPEWEQAQKDAVESALKR